MNGSDEIESIEVDLREHPDHVPGEPVKHVAFVSSIKNVARVFGVSAAAVYLWIERDMPGKHSESQWDLAAIVPWYNRVYGKKGSLDNGSKDDHDELKKQKLKVEIRKQELAYAKEIAELIPREHVRQFHGMASSKLRDAGDLLRKHHGDKSQKILLDALDAIEENLEALFRE